MDNNLREELLSNEKVRKKNLFLFNLGSAIEGFAKHALWPFGGGLLLTIIKLIIYLIPWIFVYAIVLSIFGLDSTWWLALIVYAALYGAIFGIGVLIWYKPFDVLTKLEEEYKLKYNQFLDATCAAYNIGYSDEHYVKTYEDNCYIVVGNDGRVYTSVSGCQKEFEIFLLNTAEQQETYNQRKLNLAWDEQTMENHIASIDFNRRFGLIVKKANELECMKYFNPTRQLQLIKSNVLGKCYDAFFSEYGLSFKYDDVIVENPLEPTAFLFTAIDKYFDDAEKFCAEFSQKADAVYVDLQRVEF